jgi:hypothetical protein
MLEIQFQDKGPVWLHDLTIIVIAVFMLMELVRFNTRK